LIVTSIRAAASAGVKAEFSASTCCRAAAARIEALEEMLPQVGG
jgi:hypothetical protein